MKYASRTSDLLAATLDVVERQHVVVLALDDLRDLVHEPNTPPFASRVSPYRTGVEELALTLAAAQRLPEQLTVRVVLPPDRASAVPIDIAQASLRARAADLAGESWRDAMAIRSMGHRQLPLGIGIGIAAAGAAYLAAYLACVVDTAAARGLLVVAAMVALTVAWVVGWVVVEAAILDWRLPARRAAACELLEAAQLVVEYDTNRSISW